MPSPHLFVFNPEHDLALAAGLPHFTPPRAGRGMRHDLGFLPMLWAADGDLVLVDDVSLALSAVQKLGLPAHGTPVDRATLRRGLLSGTLTVGAVRPWGWDITVRQTLIDCGVSPTILPNDDCLTAIRRISHRGWATTHLLQALTAIEGTVGRSRQVDSVADVERLLATWGSVVLKAPWSSSGRGVRRADTLTPQLRGWVSHVIRQQGSIMVEPQYNKVMDLAVELESDGQGLVDYRGLSLFVTHNGAYQGNLIDTEAHKRQRLAVLISPDVLREATTASCSLLGPALSGIYPGPLGIDMMVVRQADRLLLHPCVELNLRCTMGHVALRLSSLVTTMPQLMRVSYGEKG